MKKHTKEGLQKKKDSELRTIAKDLGVKKVAGVSKPDLVRAILKAQAGAAGKGTAADPKAKPGKKGAKRTAKPADDEEEEEDEEQEDDEEEEADEDESEDEEESDDEDEEEEPAPKKGKAGKKASPADATKRLIAALPKIDNVVETFGALTGKVNLIITVVGKLAEKAKVKLPKGWGVVAEPEEGDEDESEEAEEDEDVETVRLSAAALAKMNLAQLKDTAEQINNSDAAKAAKKKIDYEDISSARVLRDRITKFAEKYLKAADAEEDDEEEETPKKGAKKPAKGGKKHKPAEDEEDEESDDEEEDEDEEAGVPEFVHEGAKVLAFFEGEDPEWQPGSVESVDEEEGTAHIILDPSDEDEEPEEADAPFESLKPAPKKAKKRAKK